MLENPVPNVIEAIPIRLAHQPNPYIQAATSENTRKAYRYDIDHFSKWGVLPTTSHAIILYLQAFAETLNARTLSRRLIALKHWHVYQGFSDPTAYPSVRKTLKGILHVHGKPKNRAPALTLEQLIQMITLIKNQNTLAMCRNSALLQIGFFGALRCSELVRLQIEQITFVPEGIDLLIPRSKTDPIGEGQSCAIPYGDQELCPVTALKIWCEKAEITQGSIFRGIDKHGNLSAQSLSNQSVSSILKKMAKACQLPLASQFTGHSLRRGFATTASQKGAPFVSIMRHGRWRNESTVLAYIAEGQRFEANAAQVILKKDKASVTD
ncbi:MAG TPA: tyrosine-type recombinase/integrase [Gammaproteobacteria bacterium]|nr:tyrosine-type recombinase/integrase [Gammaproteobacteria bacterium]HRA43308.1 tyrosine-type recombinase/integrase [Gammaproteobacteria bacterium]